MFFWSELKRRNVYKVGIAYAIVAWLILQVASITFPALQLPGWALTLLTVLIILGFPLVLIFAWAFEITPDGLKLTKDVPKGESITHLTGRKLNYILIGVIVLAVAYILFDNYYLDRRLIETEVATRVAELVPPAVDEEDAPKTIAVLPFIDISPEKDQQYFVDGLSEELLDSLTKISGLLVTARTSSFAFKESDKTAQEIAGILGVGNILEGSVRKAGNDLRITAQLVRAMDGFHLFSKTYDRELKDIFAIQEDIAKTVADELKATLGIGALKQLGGTHNAKAYELYLIAKGQYNNIQPNCLGSIDAALVLDPEFALAWTLKSSIHNYQTVGVADNRIAKELEEGLKAAQKAIELEPNLAEAYFALGMTKTNKGDWIEAELAFLKARELITEPSLSYEVESPLLYNILGYLDRAKEIIEARLEIDPLNLISHNQYITCLALLGDTQRAIEENERTLELFGDNWLVAGNNLRFLLRVQSGDVVPKDEIPNESAVEMGMMGIDLESPEKSLEACRQLYITMGDDLPSLGLASIWYWAAYFGDPELAMNIIEKIGVSRTYLLFELWRPLMRDVRQLPRFKKYIKEIGFVDYWNEYGWPDICQPTGDGDFVCD